MGGIDPEITVGSWTWNWTELCGHPGGINPLNPTTHDLGLCFQQLCLQIPTLALMAIASAYYFGKRNCGGESVSHYALNLRLLITACLAILPIIRAYIIVTNTTILPLHEPTNSNATLNVPTIAPLTSTTPNPSFPNSLVDPHAIFAKIQNGLNDTASLAELIFAGQKNSTQTTNAPPILQSPARLYLKYTDKATSAKPIDYLVAGTEGLAWVVHFLFLLTLRRSLSQNLRGPVVIRALIFMLIGSSALLLRTHVEHAPSDDVLPNLSLGFSIGVVTFLSLYILTLIPGYRSGQSSRYREVTERTSLLSSPNSSYVHFTEVQDPNYLGVAMEDSTVLGRLLFHWVTPLMEKGVHGLLRHADDLYDLPDHITTASISHGIDRHLKKTFREKRRTLEESSLENPEVDVISSSNNISLLRLLHQCFGWQFYAVGVLKFVSDCTGFVGPMLLNKLVGFIEDQDEPMSYGYLYAFLMFANTLIGAFCITHFTFWMSIVGLKIRTAIVTLVYRKTLHSSNVQLSQQFTFGEIVNFMSTDSDRIVNSCPSFHTVWSIPLQLAVTLYLLYTQIGISFMAGVSFAIVLIPINKAIANKIGELSTKMMEFKDQRVRLMGETLRGLTAVKLNVWEEYFLVNILKLREKEIKYLKGRKYLDALCVYFWATTPVLISILTFATYVLLGNELDAKTVFTSMALLNMLIAPLNAFPWVLNGLTEAWVSVKRIQRLMDLPDLDTSTYYSDPPIGMDIMLKDASFLVNDSLEKKSESSLTPVSESPVASTSSSKKVVTFEEEHAFTLKDLNINIKKGQLIGVMGRIGSGKTLLLDGILAEITRGGGVVAVNDLEQGFGYVKQNPWLQRGTIRDNILFGKAYDHNKYKNVLMACALTNDLLSLPKKDLTGVGEAGNTLSGGQKTRISLARAVYADKSIYLLDDILATLDTKIAKHIFQHVILDLLKHKTRIICTHQTQFLIHADHVIEMSRGKVAKQGPPSEILPNLEDYLLSSIDSDLDVATMSGLPRDRHDILNEDRDPMLDEEFVETGKVQLSVYSAYMGAVGRYLAISIFLSMLLMQSSRNFTDLWLSFWVTHVNSSSPANETILPQSLRLEAVFDDGSDDAVGYYLGIYAILALLNSVFTLIRAFMFAYGGIQAAVSLHKQLLKIVMKARTTFFDVHPLGRILNRFSSDTYTVDDSLPFIANILLAQSFALLGSLIVTTYGMPWIFLLLAPLVTVYDWIQHHYRLTSRELKRLSSTALSPLYTHFNESLQGLSSIRAFRVVPRFKHENELYLDASQKTQFAAMAAGQWLSLRLQCIGVVLLAGVCVIAVLQHQFDVVDPGFIGLAITYALSVTGLLSGVVNVFTETEREIIAVERVKQYLDNIPTENSGGANPPYAWPSQGVVEFRDVSLRYRDGLTFSLKNLSFATRPAEKIGIVGRTGAGKSSIFNSLFRLVELTSGAILIDNVNVQSLHLRALRSRLSIIPQNPFLFSGTVRDNVDPLNQYPDLQIYNALEKCKLHSLVYRLGGLGANLEENGSNLSAGQKQLFCLVRAVLHNARILCIDEATANVDLETDKAIQSTIKSSFRSATVITIAHRIRTIMHCDRVIVMGDGEVLEFEEPNLLLQKTDSYFYELASQEFSDKE